jgi:hypothetical protein
MKEIKSLAFIVLIFLSGCNLVDRDNFISKRGFIVYDNMELWYFVPARSFDTSTCIHNFNSGNFGKGFQFDPYQLSNFSYIKRTFDSLGQSSASHNMYISPVEIDFSFKGKYFDLYASNSKDTKWNFKYSGFTNGRPIEFEYNNFPVTIRKINPIFCTRKKAADIGECPCTRQENDPNGYLFKICEYIKKEDRYSDLPCRYDVKSVETDTLDGRTVAKVILTCCFLGDIAYFDFKTKELIRISYGAK